MANSNKPQRSKTRNDLAPSFVRSILRYNKRTGILHWKVNRPPRAKAGGIAGFSDCQGRLVIGIRGKIYFAHRIAYVIIKGRWPKHQIDHRNHNQEDNRWNNIRNATHAQNMQNCRLSKKNTSGYKGVYRHTDGYWGAMIQANRVKMHLGLFKNKEDAAFVYQKAAKKLHKKFAHF